MRFNDPVHGSFKVEEEVLAELVESGPVQRLKHVSQAGPPEHFLDKPGITRFDHSLGVMQLLRHYDASVEEQIAGLLHDVPHTAFSHVVDFVFDTENHEYHENFLEDVVMDSEIPEILERHGLDTGYILEEENFPLLERELPDLCADRIDYFLREAKVGQGWSIGRLLESLEVDGERFVLDDREVAEEYALKYIRADEESWANPREVAVFHLFAKALRRAMDEGILAEEDLFGTDEEVLRKLEESGSERVLEPLERLEEGFDVVLDEEDPDFVEDTKVRFVDPLVVDGGERLRVTDYSERVRKRIEEHRDFVESGYPIRMVEG
ncbi:MAG: HD domain-containing protein [Candidatus Nanohaloarchaea archaeon]